MFIVYDRLLNIRYRPQPIVITVRMLLPSRHLLALYDTVRVSGRTYTPTYGHFRVLHRVIEYI
jgi:hypothetical protein